MYDKHVLSIFASGLYKYAELDIYIVHFGNRINIDVLLFDSLDKETEIFICGPIVEFACNVE
jgi:hypothetical protein